MEPIQVIEGLQEAAKVIKNARQESASFSSVVWSKINRIYDYIDLQVSNELKQYLG